SAASCRRSITAKARSAPSSTTRPSTTTCARSSAARTATASSSTSSARASRSRVTPLTRLRNSQLWIGLAVGAAIGACLERVRTRVVESEAPAPAQAVAPIATPYDALVPEKQQFVANEYQLALDLYKNRKFEQSGYELAKLHATLPAG